MRIWALGSPWHCPRVTSPKDASLDLKSKCLDLIDKDILLGAHGVDSIEAEFDR